MAQEVMLQDHDHVINIAGHSLLGPISMRLTQDHKAHDVASIASSCSSTSSTPTTSSFRSVRFSSPPDINFPSWEEGDPVRAPKLDELESTSTNPDSYLQSNHHGIYDAINRAARTGHGVPHVKRTPDTSYEPSENSNVTDLGASQREVAYAKADQECTPAQALSPHGSARVSLQDRLLGMLQSIPGHEEKKGFFPEQQLLKTITEEYVKKEIQMCPRLAQNPFATESIAREICGTTPGDGKPGLRFKKIFTILVLCEKLEAILFFLEERVSDFDLPLHKITPAGGPSKVFNLVRKHSQNVLDCFLGWSSAALWRFEEWQWTTLAPFFHNGQRKNVKHFILPDQVPLPFNTDSRFGSAESVYDRLEFEGGFSNVFKVSIHPEHHDFYKPGTHRRDFAVKCLTSRDRDEFKREADTLRKFSGNSHRHLVSLQGTYEQFGRFYLLFPWAEAHLRDYWKTHLEPTSDDASIIWMAEQCSGIADGLTKIHRHITTFQQLRTGTGCIDPGSHRISRVDTQEHNERHFRQQLFGRHGDIKPENILWFRDSSNKHDRGVLKISDFGLTEFTNRRSQCYKKNNQVAHSLTYRPPECDLEEADIGPSYDIWTLGCLYLELITWQLGGWHMLQSFQDKRRLQDPMHHNMPTDTFFEIFILDLHAHRACTEYFHEFLDLIAEEMLIVKSPNPEEGGRVSIARAHAKLDKMLKKCRVDTVYASKPAPWPRRKGDYQDEAVEIDVIKRVAEILQWRQLRIHTGRTLTRDQSPQR
ncbi:hypothetical protein VPNG_09347 [Cytospora leucostoma]|uniref:Protein kinase domain-containing protein n=1 Tax=Cytospora leucostoma TaxID=1230097 RepID=A0A423VT41_9PEZI|nr:hypothetical protein VPNG_09347 [Cytospora leucostoma]